MVDKMAKSFNGADKRKLTDAARRWRSAEADFASEHGSAMARVKEAKEDILDEIDALGVKRSTFRKVLREGRLQDQIIELRGSIDDAEQVDLFDNVKLALGMIDTPAAEPKKKGNGRKGKQDDAGAPPAGGKFLEDLSSEEAHGTA